MVEARGQGFGKDQWQVVSLDSAGRIRITPSQAGLVELRVTATDIDGFSSSKTQNIRIKDPLDTQAPVIAWQGTLLGATTQGRPVEIKTPITLQALLQDRQLMGYTLEIATANTNQWKTLVRHDNSAENSDLRLDITTLDPSLWANGIYQLRFSAWDLVGRTTELGARIIVDSQNKQPIVDQAIDTTYVLGGHSLALTRLLTDQAGDFGNWQLANVDTQLTHDSPHGKTVHVFGYKFRRIYLLLIPICRHSVLLYPPSANDLEQRLAHR